jgi:hypothetical protein
MGSPDDARIVPLFFFFGFGFLVTCWKIIKLVKILKGGRKKERKATTEETWMIQELHQSPRNWMIGLNHSRPY